MQKIQIKQLAYPLWEWQCSVFKKQDVEANARIFFGEDIGFPKRGIPRLPPLAVGREGCAPRQPGWGGEGGGEGSEGRVTQAKQRIPGRPEAVAHHPTEINSKEHSGTKAAGQQPCVRGGRNTVRFTRPQNIGRRRLLPW